MTEAPPEDDRPESFRGVVIIVWPAPTGTPPHSALSGWKCAVADAVTGKLIPTVLRIMVRAGPDEIVTADLAMFADADGNPLLEGEPVIDREKGELMTGTFPFAVAGMKVTGA